MTPYLADLACLAFLVAFSFRDALRLRAALTVSTALLVLLLYFGTTGLWRPLLWSVALLLLSLYQLSGLLQERRPVPLSKHEQRLHELVFSQLRPRELISLLAEAEWRDLPAGSTVLETGSTSREMLIIAGGAVGVRADGREVAELNEGQLVGEMGFISGKAASADVIAKTDLRLAAWDHLRLQAFLETRPNLEAAVQRVIGADLVRKLSSKAS